MPDIDFLPGNPSFSQELGRALGVGVSQSLGQQIESYRKRKTFEKAGLPTAYADLDPAIVGPLLKQQQKNALIQQVINPKTKNIPPAPTSNLNQAGDNQTTSQTPLTTNLTREQREKLAFIDPTLSKVFQTEDKLAHQKFQGERAYHTQFSAPIEKKVSERREGSRKLDFALDLSRDAIESGEIDRFSPGVLSTLPGLPEPARRALQTAKSAQLATAGKEFLFSNLSRLSAKAQNIYMEQRVGSMFPQVGQSKEANLTTQEILEGESALDKVYLKAFDGEAQKDMDQYGYIRKDIDKRVDDIIKPLDKEILNRTAFRTREIEESQWSDSKLKNQSNKKVSKGTYLTPRMGAELYKKFGDETLEHAKKLGYTIPTPEEYESFQVASREFREKFE